MDTWFESLYDKIADLLAKIFTPERKAFLRMLFSPRVVDYIRASLIRQVTLTTLILALIPIILMGSANYFRSRLAIRDQTVNQLQIVSKNQAEKLEQIARAQSAFNDTALLKAGELAVESVQSNYYNVLYQLSKHKKGRDVASQDFFDQLFVLDAQGTILVSTKKDWENINISGNPSIKRLLQDNLTLAIFDPKPLYPDQLVIFSSHTIKNSQGQPVAAIIGAIISPQLTDEAMSANSFFPQGRVLYVTLDNICLQYSIRDKMLSRRYVDTKYLEKVKGLMQGGDHANWGEYRSTNNQPVIGYARWIPSLNIGLVIEIPRQAIYQNIYFLSGFNLILLLVSLLLIASLVYIMSAQIVQPISSLVEHARAYADGDLTQRSQISRTDEIGLLANTFNRMADQLTELYRSLERRVEERTKQVRIASEIAQVAISATSREEIAERIPALVVEKFGYSYASISLIDETGFYASIHQEAFAESSGVLFKGTRVHIGPESLIGWVASNQQTRVIPDVDEETFLMKYCAPNVRSEIAIPLSAGNQILGVLNIQSAQPKSFDDETVSILETLSNQIANSLENVQLLESTQINLDEIVNLYRASRQIALSTTRDEVVQLLNNTLIETAYVSGIYAVEEDHLNILWINDPKDRNTRSTIHGITIPLLNITEELGKTSPYIVNDLLNSKQFPNILSFFTRRGCQSAALFPIYEMGQMTHIVVLGKRDQTKINEFALQPFSSLIDVAANTLSRLEILQSLSHSVNELQTLATVSRSISVETDPNRVYQVLHEQIKQAFSDDINFLISIYNPKTNQIEIPYIYEHANPEITSYPPFPLGEGLTSHLLATQKPLLINKDAEKIAREMGAKQIGKPAKSWLGVPLIVGGKSIGAIILQDTEREERFTKDDLNLIMTLAPQIASTIRNVQLLSEMQEALHAYDQERFLLTTLLDNIPDRIYFKDCESRYIRVSNSYARQFGVQSPDELAGRTEADLVGEEKGIQIAREEQTILSNREYEIGKIQNFVSNDGIEYWYLNSRIPMITSDDQVYGLLGISRDITELKQAEERAQLTAGLLRTIAEIARDISGTLEVGGLLNRAVNLVRDRFGFYHASIFLIDANNEFAVLRESTGEAGSQMKAMGHRLAVGSQSIVGQVTALGEPKVVNDVYLEPYYYPNPLLPETNSELTIPLKVGTRIIGALDVQSTQLNAFSAQDVSILNLLADQLAVAIFNAELFAQTQANVEKHRLLHEITTAAASGGTIDEALLATVRGLHNTLGNSRAAIFFLTENKRLEVRASAGFEGFDLSKLVYPIGESLVGLTAKIQEPLLIKDTRTDPRVIDYEEDIRSQLAVPILYRGSLIGVLSVESKQPGAYSENDLEILATLGNSLGAVIFNAQLVEEVRQQVIRQRMIYDATNRIRRSVDIESILQTSVAEIGRAAGASRARIELKISETVSDQATKGNSRGKEISL